MFRTVALPSSTAYAAPQTSPPTSTTSALSTAMSLPSPIAMPTSALVNAGASLMPSPTIATFAPPFINSVTLSALSPGSTSAIVSSIPASHAIARAVAALSPVSMIVLTCPACKSSISSFAPLFKPSASETTPIALPSYAAATTLAPSA